MKQFDLRNFLTENKLTEQSRLLSEVKGSDTKEGKEILKFFSTELGVGKAGFNYMVKSLDMANPMDFKSAYKHFKNNLKNSSHAITPHDAATINNILRGK